MSRTCLFFTLLFSGLISFGQNRLLPGYIVLDNDDTLRGYVQLKGFNTAPERVYYAKDNSGQAREYSIEECKAFGIDNDVYQRSIVKMDMSVMNTLDYVIHNPDSILVDTVFLKQIHNGKYLSLFKYYKGNESALIKPEKEKPHFFLYDKENDNMQELILRFENPYKNLSYDPNIHRYSGNLVQRQTKCIYRDQLCAYFDWTTERKLKRKINELEYSEHALVKIVSTIDAKIK